MLGSLPFTLMMILRCVVISALRTPIHGSTLARLSFMVAYSARVSSSIVVRSCSDVAASSPGTRALMDGPGAVEVQPRHTSGVGQLVALQQRP